ncbi:MAG: hypothetical protein AB7K24_24290, partial [Gemmataceae bacterium]
RCRIETEERVKMIPYTTCRIEREECTRMVPHTTCRMEPYCVKYKVCRRVPVCVPTCDTGCCPAGD